MTRYPFVPRSNVHLEPGQLWSVPLRDGRFGCGRVLAIDRSAAYGGRTLFTGALHDWVGTDAPTSAAIAGSPVIAVGRAHVRVIADGGGEVLGMRPLGVDGIEVPDQVSTFWGPAYPEQRLARRFIDGDPPPTAEVRVVGSPLTDEMLAPSPTGRGTVQFLSRLTDDDFRRLGAWFADYPEMGRAPTGPTTARSGISSSCGSSRRCAASRPMRSGIISPRATASASAADLDGSASGRPSAPSTSPSWAVPRSSVALPRGPAEEP